ncbi:MAG: pyridoxal phosphate-dependent aminotransferase [Deltaproteobacteria bacterium]|nr:pyridoxal phosphate-dependent aminotransferase [Deltaproteobacteria bacterium]
MTISKQMRRYLDSGSLIRKLFEEGAAMRADGTNRPVYDFSLGNPSLAPPQQFDDALGRYVQNDARSLHGYMANAGLTETREAVARSLKNDHGLSFDASHVLMTVGAAGAVNVALKTLLNPGDEVLVCKPYFVEYEFYAENHGGKLITVPATRDFNLDIDAFAAAITPRTRVVIITNPNNPTGVMYPQETLNALGDVLRSKSAQLGQPIYLLDDAPYRKLVYDVPRCTSSFSAYEHTLMATSHSKDLSLPGERIGFLALSPKMTDCKMVAAGCAIASRILGFVNAPALMQYVAAALQDVTIDLDWYRRRRDRLFTSLTSYGYEMPHPDGAFYLFVKAPGGDDFKFVEGLKRRRVLTVPGSGFGTPGYFRIAYCVSDSIVEESLSYFKEAMDEVYRNSV